MPATEVRWRCDTTARPRGAATPPEQAPRRRATAVGASPAFRRQPALDQAVGCAHTPTHTRRAVGVHTGRPRARSTPHIQAAHTAAQTQATRDTCERSARGTGARGVCTQLPPHAHSLRSCVHSRAHTSLAPTGVCSTCAHRALSHVRAWSACTCTCAGRVRMWRTHAHTELARVAQTTHARAHTARALTPSRVYVYTSHASPHRARTHAHTHVHAQGSHARARTHRARTHMRTHRARTHVRAHTELTQTCVRGVRGPARRGWSSGHASGAPQTRRKGCHLSHHGTPHREAGPRAMFPTCPPRGPAHRGALAHRGAMPMNLFPTCPPRGPAH